MTDLMRFSDDIQEALAYPEITNACALAARIGAASTPTSDEEAAVLTDAAKVCKEAATKAEAELKTITGPLREAEQSARNLAKPVIEQLRGAEATAKQRIGEWLTVKQKRAAAEQAERDRIAAAERERVRREREEAARIAAEGELPVPEVAPAVIPEVVIEAPKQARGTVGLASGRRTLKVAAADMVKIATAHPEWLALNEASAREGFKNALRLKVMEITYATGKTPDDADAEPAAVAAMEAMGIKAWYEQGVSLR